jgi:hypothetical protein
LEAVVQLTAFVLCNVGIFLFLPSLFDPFSQSQDVISMHQMDAVFFLVPHLVYLY